MATLKSHELKPPEYIDVIHTVQFSDDYTNPVSQPHGARWRMRRWWRRFNQIWADSWAPEIASCFIALGSLVSLIVILAVYDNEVLQDVPLGLSINTVVSILASTLKASMIMPVAESISQLKWLWFGGNDRPLRDFEHFDQASRGPWGSILLVFHLRSHHLVSIGAWITIATLAIDPFSQQIIDIYSCERVVAPAAIQITTNVTGIAQASPGYYDYALNPDLDVAIFTGLLGKTGRETSANLFTCPSGNCTFPAAPDTGASYQTLAIESSCTDITSSVLLDETYGWILPPRTEFLDPSLLDAIQNTTWIFPTSVKESEFENQVRKSVRGLYPIEEYPRMRTALRSFGPFASITDALFKRKFLMLNVDWDSTPIIFDLKEDLTWGGQPRAAYPTKPFAAECELYPVIRTIKGSIESFRLEEDILSSERVHVSMVDPGRSLSLWHLSTHALRNGTWSPCTSSRTRSPATPIEFINGTLHSYYFKNRNADGRWSLASTRGELYFDTEEELMAWGNRSFYPKDCVWEVEGMIPLTLTQHFGKVFDYASVHTTNYSNMSTYFGDPWMRRLYANGTANLTTVEAYAANLAESMSNYIRAWGDSGTPVLVEGQSYRTETCIKVEWKLGAFPASLVPLAFIFLALTIWRTKRQEVRQPPWRSSSLPVLIHGLAHAGKRNDMKGLERNSEMEDVSGDIKVRLAKGERGWGLQ